MKYVLIEGRRTTNQEGQHYTFIYLNDKNEAINAITVWYKSQSTIKVDMESRWYN